MDLTQLGSTIKKLRNGLSLTQEELATKIGVTWEMISRYERGLSSPLSRLDSLAKALQTDVANLIAQAYSLTLRSENQSATITLIPHSEIRKIRNASSLSDILKQAKTTNYYNAPQWIMDLDQKIILIELEKDIAYYISENIQPKANDKVLINRNGKLTINTAKKHPNNIGMIVASLTRYIT